MEVCQVRASVVALLLVNNANMIHKTFALTTTASSAPSRAKVPESVKGSAMSVEEESTLSSWPGRSPAKIRLASVRAILRSAGWYPDGTPGRLDMDHRKLDGKLTIEAALVRAKQNVYARFDARSVVEALGEVPFELAAFGSQGRPCVGNTPTTGPALRLDLDFEPPDTTPGWARTWIRAAIALAVLGLVAPALGDPIYEDATAGAVPGEQLKPFVPDKLAGIERSNRLDYSVVCRAPPTSSPMEATRTSTSRTQSPSRHARHVHRGPPRRRRARSARP